MNWSLPTSIEIDGKTYNIRNKCDYRVILDIISALNDNELDEKSKIQCALYIFFEDVTGLTNVETALSEMMKIINLGEELKTETTQETKPKIMDWEHDFSQIIPPINRVLGYSVRDANKYTHWYDFVGAYMEIGECSFATIISIRNKRQKGKKLEEHERQFYKDNKELIDLPQKLTENERDWLDGDW